jgi:hypothetical protein
MKNQKKNRRPLWQGKLEKLSGVALCRCAADELEMDELTVSESQASLDEFFDEDVVIDSDLDLFERFGLDDDDRFDDGDCGYLEDNDYGYFQFAGDTFRKFSDALDRARIRNNGISLWDLPAESQFYLLGFISDPSLDERNWDELLAELLSGAESEECEAAYRRPRISNFIALPGGRRKRLKGSRNGSRNKSARGSNKRLARFYGVLEQQSRRKQGVPDALYRAYEEEVHSIEAEIREQERLDARESFRLRLRTESQNPRTTGSDMPVETHIETLNSVLGFRSSEELNAYIRASLLGKKRK